MEFEEFEVAKPSFLVLGLPDTGLVGAISSNHIVEQLSLREVAGIDMPMMGPPLAIIINSEVKTPLRIHHGNGGRVLALTSEAPVPATAMHALSKLLVDYALKRGIEYIISIVGLASPNRINVEKPRVYWLASNPRAAKLVEGLGVENFANGYLVGPYALVLKEAIRKRVANLILLAESFVDFPDPEAAAQALTVLSRILGVNIDVSKLLEQAEMIRLRLRGLMKQTRQSMAEMGGPSPLMYS
jgi:uncharacterized protein